MAITIDGTGTITGISAGGLPDGCITDAELENGTTCKAWINFNGTGTVAIRASYNVGGLTDSGTGYYTVTLTNALVDANYAVATMAASTAALNTMESGSDTGAGINTASSFYILTANNSGTLTDARTVSAALFR